ncbi:MAG: NADH-quinone oxidoreductase subunit J [Holophagales bacterium]|jgi:NADH-quinone oxidoreductase subunit J|nr:NADH-quinone oxidoreductase subunit J [Holophagales bacterium]
MFLAFALITLGAAFALFMQRNAVQAGLCMMLSFFGVAGLFLLLSNPVAAALQVIIYSGAITILVLFVVMLLQSHQEEPAARPGLVQKILSAVLVAVLALGAIKLVFSSSALANMPLEPPNKELMTLHKLGEQLFSEHIVALEAVGLLLLSAMVAAVILVKKEAQ